MDRPLSELIAQIKAARGDNWTERSNALHRHIAELPDECRIMAVGEHRLRCYHGPAALIYDARLTAERVVVHYAQQDGTIADWGQVQNFHSNTPHRASRTPVARGLAPRRLARLWICLRALRNAMQPPTRSWHKGRRT